jgi:hypothetical protein
MKDTEVGKQVPDKNSNKKKFDHESFRRQLVQSHKSNTEKKNVEKAARNIEMKLTPHINSTTKSIPEESATLKVIKETARHYLYVRQSRTSSIKPGMTNKEHVEMDEALGTIANIKKAALDATKRTPGAPAWLTQAIKANASKAAKKIQKKEVEQVNEAKRGRPRKDGVKPGVDDDHQEADQNIHTQLHKVISAKKAVTFNNGEKKEIAPQHAHKALSMLQNAKPSDRLAIQNSLSHSHKRFMDTITSGKAVVDVSRPKVSLGKMKAESFVVEDEEVSDKRANKSYIRRLPNGSVKLVNYTPSREPINVESFKPLNNLYNDLSEENKIIFNSLMETEEGVASLIDFATEQGY